MKLIELKDHRLSIRQPDGILAESPGFANIAGKEPVFGDAARQMARLHPRESFNQFWHQLSLDPLLLKTRWFRHNADLAHSHLQTITSGVDLGEGAILAAPTTYTRNHLAVLLGVVKQSNIKALGLVDHALLQAVSTGAEECIVLDLQLHQAVLAAFRRHEGVLLKDKVVQIPGAGLLALYDAWSSAVVEEFLLQSRFDPTHSAETEQYISNQLETWMAASGSSGELLLEINHKGTVHQARLTHEAFVLRSKSLFARIARELPELASPEATLHVHGAHLNLPGLASAFPGIQGVADDAAMQVCLHHQDALVRPGEALAFVTRLTLANGAGAAAAMPTLLPTHVLYQHRAVALPQGRLALGTPPDSLSCARILPMPEWQLPGAVTLQRSTRGVTVETFGAIDLRCNDAPIASGHVLKLGDRLQAGEHNLPLQLILVE